MAVTALSTVLALSACSGGDDEQDASSDGPSARPTPPPDDSFTRACQVTVEASGAAEVSWEGKGEVSDRVGSVVYTYVDGEDAFRVYAGTDDIATNANLALGGATYTTTDPAAGLDVADDGSGARVDAETAGVDGPGPHVTATFTCGKKK